MKLLSLIEETPGDLKKQNIIKSRLVDKKYHINTEIDGFNDDLIITIEGVTFTKQSVELRVRAEGTIEVMEDLNDEQTLKILPFDEYMELVGIENSGPEIEYYQIFDNILYQKLSPKIIRYLQYFNMEYYNVDFIWFYRTTEMF